jgi:transposase
MKTRRKFTAEFKTKVVLEAIKEQFTLSELAQKFEIHPNQIQQWKRQFVDNASMVFSAEKADLRMDQEEQVSKLYEQIGKLQVANDFLKKKLS